MSRITRKRIAALPNVVQFTAFENIDVMVVCFFVPFVNGGGDTFFDAGSTGGDVCLPSGFRSDGFGVIAA